jgi:membrane protease YdiL (CAAX protease family)
VLRFGVLTFLISVALSLVVLPWLALSWWTIFRRCVSIGAAVSVWLCARLERRSLRSYGLSSARAGKSDLLFGLLLGLGTLGLMGILGLASGACRIDVTPDRMKLWRTVIGFLPAAALVSVLEELVFRGLILQHLLAFSKPAAVAASSALYAVVHVKTLTLATWLELGGLLLLGGVLALSYLVTHQLYLAIGLHGVLAYGARINKLVIDIPETSLGWLVGTSRLVNGLAGWLAVLGIGGMILWWARRSHGGAYDGAT